MEDTLTASIHNGDGHDREVHLFHLDTSRALPLYPEVMNTTAERIKSLNLQAHPEEDGGDLSLPRHRHLGRASVPACTGILFLLEQGRVSTFHRIDADELWHYHEGEPRSRSHAE